MAAIKRAIEAEHVAAEALSASHDEGFGDCQHFDDPDDRASDACELCDASAVVHALIVTGFIPREAS